MNAKIRPKSLSHSKFNSNVPLSMILWGEIWLNLKFNPLFWSLLLYATVSTFSSCLLRQDGSCAVIKISLRIQNKILISFSVSYLKFILNNIFAKSKINLNSLLQLNAPDLFDSGINRANQTIFWLNFKIQSKFKLLLHSATVSASTMTLPLCLFGQNLKCQLFSALSSTVGFWSLKLILTTSTTVVSSVNTDSELPMLFETLRIRFRHYTKSLANFTKKKTYKI